MKMILQTESSECGLACLAMIADHHGYQSEMADLRRRFSVSLKGATVTHLIRHAAALRLSARAVRLELEDFDQLKLPCVLHWNLNHFVVLKKIKGGLGDKLKVTIVDPAYGERILSIERVSQYFTGVALELTPMAAFEKKDEMRKVSIVDLTGKIRGLPRALVQMFALSISLEVFALISPLFNQFVVDDVIVNSDRELLTVLVMAFALMLATQTSIAFARSWFLMRWSIDVGLQWSIRVFAHLIRLPAVFFEKRHLGDIVSRFGSVSAIQGTLTSLFVESALDGIMAIVALALMLFYSQKLSLIVILSVCLYSLLRWVFYYPLREASRERLVLAAKESSNFLETIRAITPLKLFGREAERQHRWLNLKQNVINRDIKTQKLGILFKVSNTTISSVQSLALFYLGAGQVIEGSLSIGMLMAFTSYASTFSGRVFSLVDAVVSLRMLSIQSDRLADIVLEEPEPMPAVEMDVSRLDANITLRNVKFRYAEGEPFVLDGINLHIPAGQSIALTGPSGCGKSTLCKLVLGLISPTEGDILIDSVPIDQIGLYAYRQLVGTVMQDDVLLAGSILENISFFDSWADPERTEDAARLAAIHDEIIAMPMGYQTLVGDMGSSLSGGQKQRILLARALFKQPKILALDEATSHLDVINERKVNAALTQLNLTRIMVAHRPETIEAAGRVVELKNGKIVEVRPPIVEDRVQLPSATMD